MTNQSRAFYTDFRAAKKANHDSKMTVSVTTLRKDGQPSKAHDATTLHKTVQEALSHIRNARTLNPQLTLNFRLTSLTTGTSRDDIQE